ncbi:hypothetical protein [uncultured Ruegeria sp.]|uniref:hypothetical protein n=1 Tax=uncultured Ruegeria sp. TaxID=259304 RepID=UPI002607A0A9|nr:hypothetical protein [uncultured Ruegeria sp.]
MTRIASSLNPAPTPPRHAETPAGHTKADLPHGTKAKSSCRGVIRKRDSDHHDWVENCSPGVLILAGGAVSVGTFLIAHIGTPYLFRLFDLIAGALQ